MIPILRIQLLGGFQLISGDTPITAVELPRLQSLLAYLLMHRGTPIARQQLAFLLWPDSAEGQARSNLRTLVARLRGALPHADAFLSSDTHSLQWQPDGPWALDVADFEQALALAEQAGNQVAARVALEQAADLYRGDLLPGCYDDWILPERERLQQLFLAALERLIQLHEQQRDYPAAIQVAQRLLRHDPLAEATYQHLMRLHALNGDRASALRVYQTCVTVLRRELDVEPSPATRATYERLAHEASAAQPTPAPASPRAHTLPIPLTSFVGRVRERAEVARLLGTTRLLTLTGAGGSGKTRLALTVAADRATAYADGVALVELAALADPALVPQAVAVALGLHEESQRSPTTLLAEALRGKQMLLVLDNCEHLIVACAQLAQALLAACPGLQVLATSRESLGVAGETTWLVPSLSLPDLRRLPPDGAGVVARPAGVRGGRPVCRARVGGAADLRPGARERRGGGAGLPAAGWHPAGDRAGGGARQDPDCRAAGGAAGRLLSAAGGGQPDGAAAPADAARRDRLELRSALRAGAGAVPAAGGLRGRLDARGCRDGRRRRWHS